tara:strand:+ start:445 stop:603 length:159 start_codon:yes stop_codon:yes gene_type:complete
MVAWKPPRAAQIKPAVEADEKLSAAALSGLARAGVIVTFNLALLGKGYINPA